LRDSSETLSLPFHMSALSRQNGENTTTKLDAIRGIIGDIINLLRKVVLNYRV